MYPTKEQMIYANAPPPSPRRDADDYVYDENDDYQTYSRDENANADDVYKKFDRLTKKYDTGVGRGLKMDDMRQWTIHEDPFTIEVKGRNINVYTGFVHDSIVINGIKIASEADRRGEKYVSCKIRGHTSIKSVMRDDMSVSSKNGILEIEYDDSEYNLHLHGSDTIILNDHDDDDDDDDDETTEEKRTKTKMVKKNKHYIKTGIITYGYKFPVILLIIWFILLKPSKYFDFAATLILFYVLAFVVDRITQMDIRYSTSQKVVIGIGMVIMVDSYVFTRIYLKLLVGL